LNVSFRSTERQTPDTWQQAIDLWGEKGVVDLIGVNGYYSFLSMIMNGAQTPVPDTRDFILPA
ncbi:TPA: hypothetical protein KUM59_005442, partial [Citrobacter freundii]|nr:hypothetical protein [Citrobacter freundii]